MSHASVYHSVVYILRSPPCLEERYIHQELLMDFVMYLFAAFQVGLPNYGGAEMGELVYLSRDACSMDKTAIPRPSVTRPQGSELLPLIVLTDSSDATGKS